MALKPLLIIFCLPTERVRIKRGVSLMLNKFLFTRLEVMNCMEPFQTNLSGCNRHRFYFPPPVSARCTRSHLSFLPRRSNFPLLPLKTAQRAPVSAGVTLDQGPESGSFEAALCRLQGKVRDHGKFTFYKRTAKCHRKCFSAVKQQAEKH